MQKQKYNYCLNTLLLLLFYITNTLHGVDLNSLNSWTTPLTQRPLKKASELANLPLFKTYPLLAQKLPHISLCTLPTPIKKLDKLGSHLGIKQLYLKHDGLSAPFFGGNKVRKLEFLLADALDSNAAGVITVGSAGSNHCVATATHTQRIKKASDGKNLTCTCMLTPQQNITSYLQRNLLLDVHAEAQLRYFATREERNDAIDEIVKTSLEKQEKPPYFIPVGGSNPLGAIGFINAAFELKEQVNRKEIPEPDYLYVTCGSGGTAAGLIIGAKLAGLKTTIIPVLIAGFLESNNASLCNLINETSKLLNSLDSRCKLITVSPEETNLNAQFQGEAKDVYGKVTEEAAQAIGLLHKLEKTKVDGTYAGKTLAAMLHDIQEKKLQDKTVLFWDTFCEGTFEKTTNNVSYKSLPKELHSYFEQPVQTLDQGC